ncbi:hypothetical protein GGGNBK_15520 [Sporosarcina sp. ANT_H38]
MLNGTEQLLDTDVKIGLSEEEANKRLMNMGLINLQEVKVAL